MAEIQEQSHKCKVCSKNCDSGRSLGGHMRLHVASRKGASSKIKIEETGYGLRSNPKQSWRVSDPEQGIDCEEELPTPKALLSHVKCHESEVHQCKECGKGFDSARAMFGHMKSHSKKCGHKKSGSATDEGLFGLVANLCPVRRKRSRIKYNVVPNGSCSSLNENVLEEEDELRRAAESLVMLSRGVAGWGELSDENLDFGNELKAGFGVLETKGLVEIADDKAGLELVKPDSWKGKGVLGNDSDSESSTRSENDDHSFNGLRDVGKKRKCYRSLNVISNFYQSVTEASLQTPQLGCSSLAQIEQVEVCDSAGIGGRLDRAEGCRLVLG